FLMLGLYFAYYCFGLFAGLVLIPELMAPFADELAAGPLVFLLGVALHKTLVSQVTGTSSTRLDSEGHYAQLILTLGISLVFANGGLVLFGSAPVSISTPLSSTPWIVEIGNGILIFVNQGQSISALIAIAVVVAFALLMAKSRLGRRLRAAADNPEAAIYMGIDVDRAYRIAFGFGVGITAIGGGLLASTNPFQPYIGIEFVIVMYAGVVLGGLGSLSGAFFGGLIIGLVQQLSALILPTQLQNTSIFVCFLIIVLLKPDGLFGKASRRA
ncbi:MAG: branched-chain amino acid ABC transporter permease, partial [Gammaproteobacteria bacterium]|nr:branched-chain amino acid ABC transporter permease [Gammaproteobacteria bacterium]